MAYYKKEQQLGKGAFGVCYRCKSQKGSTYALKEINLSRVKNDKQWKDAISEVLVLKALQHPGIVRLRDAFIEEARGDKKLCIVMEFCAGGDLASFLQKAPTPPEEVVLPWMLQLTEALSYLHQNKVIHRDLKPANILLSADKKLKLADFGISKSCESTAAEAFTRIGTLMYMAPEMVRSSFSGYSNAVDVWALGCVFYELLTGHAPFHRATNMAALVQQIVQYKPDAIPNSVRGDLVLLVDSMLLKAPERRPSAMAMLDQPLMHCVREACVGTPGRSCAARPPQARMSPNRPQMSPSKSPKPAPEAPKLSPSPCPAGSRAAVGAVGAALARPAGGHLAGQHSPRAAPQKGGLQDPPMHPRPKQPVHAVRHRAQQRLLVELPNKAPVLDHIHRRGQLAPVLLKACRVDRAAGLLNEPRQHAHVHVQ